MTVRRGDETTAKATGKVTTVTGQGRPNARLRLLSEKCLELRDCFPERPRPSVPPTSPKELIFDYSFTSLPRDFPRLAELKLPCIREEGVKAAIQQLAQYFHCKDYKLNLIQFWFLDIVTDCLWRAQDEFQFPDEHQKIILEWILYIFNLIRAQHLNLSKRKLFSLFREAIAIAEDYIQSGAPTIPLPDELFTLNSEPEVAGEESYTTLNASSSAASTDSTISLHSSSASSSYVAVKFEDNTEFFRLPMKTCPWDTDDDECMSSSVETVSEIGLNEVKDDVEEETAEEEEEEEQEDFDFYKPARGIPPRFVSSRISFGGFSLSFSSDSVLNADSSSEDSKAGESAWVDVPRKPQMENQDDEQMAPCPDMLSVKKEVILPPVESETPKKGDKKDIKSPTKLPPPEEPPPAINKEEEEQLLKAWFDYHVWQEREIEMCDPKRGWVPLADANDEYDIQEPTYSNEEGQINVAKEEWIDYLDKRKHQSKAMQENMFINTCVLLAIKQFVFDYFYESFLFTLLKITFRCSHGLITQEVNDKWYVPKIMKVELKKPKPKKPPKEKKPKEPKAKKEKPVKEKPKKEKPEKPKKEKPKALTKEEKAELARLKKEQERLEEERRKEEENRRFMFPLGEAATDDFFKSIFDNWVKVDPKGKGKGKK